MSTLNCLFAEGNHLCVQRTMTCKRLRQDVEPAEPVRKKMKAKNGNS